jgi:hypothetical protein
VPRREGEGKAPKLPPLSEAGSGSLHEKEKARLDEIIAKVNDLLEGDLTDDDQVVSAPPPAGWPHDLGFPDCKILAGSQDGIVPTKPASLVDGAA